MAIDPLIVRNLHAERANEGGDVEMIKEFSYRFQRGLFYQLAGADLGGKSLMLELLGLLYPPTSGEIIVDDLIVSDLEIDALGDTRNRKYGFLFSAPFLLPAFTVLENIAMPLFKIARVEPSEAKIITEEILEMLGISEIASAAVTDLNCLDENLTALGRAVVHRPHILIAQDVGNNLGPKEVDAFLSMLRMTGQNLGLTIIATSGEDVRWKQADVCLNVAATGIEKT
jgi:ABC-type lipoprotein export system ATPase subunit